MCVGVFQLLILLSLIVLGWIRDDPNYRVIVERYPFPNGVVSGLIHAVNFHST